MTKWDEYILPYEKAVENAEKTLLSLPITYGFAHDKNGNVKVGAGGKFILEGEESEERIKAIDEYDKAVAVLESAKAYKGLGFSERCANKGLFTVLDEPREAFIGKERERLTKAYLEQFGRDVKGGKTRGLIFCGNAGTGKTIFSAAIAQRLCFSGVSCRFIFMPDLLEKILKALGFNSKTGAHSLITDTLDKRFIVIDELGRALTANNKGALFELFDTLWTAGCSYIITSNSTVSGFADSMDAACFDRLRSCSTFVSFEGESYR